MLFIYINNNNNDNNNNNNYYYYYYYYYYYNFYYYCKYRKTLCPVRILGFFVDVILHAAYWFRTHWWISLWIGNRLWPEDSQPVSHIQPDSAVFKKAEQRLLARSIKQLRLTLLTLWVFACASIYISANTTENVFHLFYGLAFGWKLMNYQRSND